MEDHPEDDRYRTREVDEPQNVPVAEDLARVPEVPGDSDNAVARRQDRVGMAKHHGVVIDVDGTCARLYCAGSLVRLGGGETAVDGEHRPGCPACVVGCQEHGGLGDILRGAELGPG